MIQLVILSTILNIGLNDELKLNLEEVSAKSKSETELYCGSLKDLKMQLKAVNET